MVFLDENRKHGKIIPSPVIERFSEINKSLNILSHWQGMLSHRISKKYKNDYRATVRYNLSISSKSKFIKYVISIRILEKGESVSKVNKLIKLDMSQNLHIHVDMAVPSSEIMKDVIDMLSSLKGL